MKKLILITGIVLYSLFAVAMLADSDKRNELVNELVKETYSVERITESDIKELYVLKAYDGRIAVADGATGEIIKKTDTLVSILPKKDRNMLKKGIKVNSDEELRLLLEDFCS